MSLYAEILSRKSKLSVIGLGYVGMPLAVAFAKQVDVIGFDVDATKIKQYRSGIDHTNEVGNDTIRKTTVDFTSNETKLRDAKFHVIAVPTPINMDKTPDLASVEGASKVVGRNLVKGSIIVYESTVYPGVTEEICVPILERESGLVCGVDFKVGYSPERINPGDKIHKLDNIIKIVSGMDSDSLEDISKIYELIIDAGVHRVSSIKVAEAAKVAENSQRDINIAFMNELAMVFDRMEIDTYEVIQAMNTKWNALRFYPGLVGGHCIGVDPHYFIYRAERLGYHSQIILSGRKINDDMGGFVAEAILKKMIVCGKVIKNARVFIFGITFKENCSDIRNSKVMDIVNRLREYNVEPYIVDPRADSEEVKKEYGISLLNIEDVRDADCVVFAVGHDEFKNMDIEVIDRMFKDGPVEEKILIDVKSILNKREFEKLGYTFWRL